MDPASSISAFALVGFIGFLFGAFVGSIGGKASASSGGSFVSSGGINQHDLRRLESKVDVLLQHFDLASEADSKVKLITEQYGVPPEVLALLPTRKIDAIVLYRKIAGVGLKEAKDKIDEACKQMRS
jgi:hypothetical protein